VPRRTRSSPGESIPVGAAEIAARLGVKPQTVHTWRHRKLMPHPRWTVSGHAAWDWAEIEAWGRRTGRLREPDVHAALLELEGIGWAGDLDEMRSHCPSLRR
jgi:predicted DNA-binding transcriptional regulator AlpA